MESKDGKMSRKMLKKKFRLAVNKSQKGISLVEVMMAVSILVIFVLGSASLFAYGADQINQAKQSRVAVQLVNQKLEQLRADNNVSIEIPDGETTEDISLGAVSYQRMTVIEDLGSYKKGEVTVSWTQMGKDRSVNMVTLYVKR